MLSAKARTVGQRFLCSRIQPRAQQHLCRRKSARFRCDLDMDSLEAPIVTRVEGWKRGGG